MEIHIDNKLKNKNENSPIFRKIIKKNTFKINKNKIKKLFL